MRLHLTHSCRELTYMSTWINVLHPLISDMIETNPGRSDRDRDVCIACRIHRFNAVYRFRNKPYAINRQIRDLFRHSVVYLQRFNLFLPYVTACWLLVHVFEWQYVFKLISILTRFFIYHYRKHQLSHAWFRLGNIYSPMALSFCRHGISPVLLYITGRSHD